MHATSQLTSFPSPIFAASTLFPAPLCSLCWHLWAHPPFFDGKLIKGAPDPIFPITQHGPARLDHPTFWGRKWVGNGLILGTREWGHVNVFCHKCQSNKLGRLTNIAWETRGPCWILCWSSRALKTKAGGRRKKKVLLKVDFFCEVYFGSCSPKKGT